MVTMDVDTHHHYLEASSRPLIDELQYSRLICSLGKEAVLAVYRSRALILGCTGLGAEIAKNLILSGIAGIGLLDEERVRISDLGSNFCLRSSDVGRIRAVAVAENLREFYPSAAVDVVTDSSLESSLFHYQVVVATTGSLSDLICLDRLCRATKIPFIASQSRGLFSYVFTDLGDSFNFKDQTGISPSLLLIANVTQDFPATVTVVEEQRHGLEDGDEVVFSGIKGMKELNNNASYRVTVTGSHSFSIPVDTREFHRYISGGYFQKVIPLKSLHYNSFEAELQTPTFSATDNLKLSHQPHLHVALQAIDEFMSSKKENVSASSSPRAVEEADVDKIVTRAREIWEISTLSCECTSNYEQDHQEKSPSSDAETVKENKGGNYIDSDSLTANTSSGDTLPVAKFSVLFGPLDEKLVRTLVQAINVELCPLVALTGGLAAQEVLKVLGKICTPLQQWMYYDAVDCAPYQVMSNGIDNSPLQSRYDQQIALFGSEFQQKLGSLQWLVVGAGGIGCEVLKNLVLMGVGCSSNGSITVTDMDRISKPNYTDQLLYTMDDIGKHKAATAARALRKINPDSQIRVIQERFDVDTENIFDSSFFHSISGVFSAVDTASSRLYIDMRCVTFRKPMIDGGKHGTKGSVQVFLPFQSEMYASSRDPPEFKETPICTLRNFPYSTEHTIQWAVETFESLFKQRPEDVNAYLSNRDFQESIRKANPAARLPILETLCDSLSRYKPLSFAACIQWARLQFEELFVNNVKQLSFNFPDDMMTTNGAPFWSGTKRAPVPIKFDVMNPLHYDFIVASSNLQATVYGLKGCQDRSLFMDVLRTVEVPSFQPKEGIKIAVTDNDLRNGGQKNLSCQEDRDAADKCEALMQDLPTPASLVGYRLTPIEFEKDDEKNFHLEFVVSAANLRAQNYGIPATDVLQARYVGGRTIPSIITSTSVVGGLMCLELYKLVLGKSIDYFKHSYLNLAVPMISYAEPIKAVINRVERIDRPPLLWTLWDKFEMNCAGMSLERFLKEYKEQHGLEITMLSYGKSLLYAEFVPKKKLQERMTLSLLDLITTVAKVTIPATENQVVFSLSCSDASENDVDVPDIVVQVR